MESTSLDAHGSDNTAALATEQIAKLTSTVTDLVEVVKNVQEELSSYKSQSKKALESVRLAQKALNSQNAIYKSGDKKIVARKLIERGSVLGFSLIDDALVQARMALNDDLDAIVNTGETFSCFNKLPPELRMRIWKLALPSRRIFLPVFEDNFHASAVFNPNSILARARERLEPPLAFPGPVQLHFMPQPPILAAANGGAPPGILPGFAAPMAMDPAADADPAAPAPDTPDSPDTPFSPDAPGSRDLRLDFPTVRLSDPHPTPSVRSVCREARRAASEAGSFEFGIYGTSRRGYWFNHAEDIVSIRTETIPHLRHIDLSRIQTVGFLYIHFHEESAATVVLDLVLRHVPRCQKVIYYFDPDNKHCRPHVNTGGSGTNIVLMDDDMVGFPAFSPARGLSDGPVAWRDLRNAILQIWSEHLKSKGRNKDQMPALVGVDVVRQFPRW